VAFGMFRKKVNGSKVSSSPPLIQKVAFEGSGCCVIFHLGKENERSSQPGGRRQAIPCADSFSSVLSQCPDALKKTTS